MIVFSDLPILALNFLCKQDRHYTNNLAALASGVARISGLYHHAWSEHSFCGRNLKCEFEGTKSGPGVPWEIIQPGRGRHGSSDSWIPGR